MPIQNLRKQIKHIGYPAFALLNMDIKVKIIRKKVKNLTLRINADCQPVLTVPFFTPSKTIEAFLKHKEEWLKKKINFFYLQNVKNLKNLENGGNFHYLGKIFQVKIIRSNTNFVQIENGFCCIFVTEDSFGLKEKLTDNWYYEKAKELFPEIVEKFTPLIGKKVNVLRIKKMKTRWGSCNPQKQYINLNQNLIKKDLKCIEMVIFHELVHLLYPNHGQEFYSFLGKYMPDWKKRKEMLKV